MKLVYLWVERFWCFKEQGFHFTKEYCFQMIKKEEAAPQYALSVKKGNAAIRAGEVFKGNILDFRIFVGENGRGKTALSKLAETAFGRLADGIMQEDLKLLAVFEEEEGGSLSVCDWGFGKEELLIEGNGMKKNGKALYVPRLIFLNEKSREDIKVQIEFVYDYRTNFTDFKSWISFPVPQKLKIIPEMEEMIFRKAVFGLQQYMTESISDMSPISQYATSAIEKLNEVRLNLNMWIKRNIDGIVGYKQQSFVRTVCSAILYKLIYNTQWTSRSETELAIERADKFVQKLEQSQGNNIWSRLRNILKEMGQQDTMDSFLEMLDEDVKCEGKGGILEIHEAEQTEYSKKTLSRLLRFYDSYISAVFDGYPEFLHFNWGLSSGEYNMLNTFSHIHKFQKETGESKETVFLFLDEIDLSLHPRWQQQYLKVMLNFLKEEFQGRKLQLCLATHSPIILSDIPHQFITYFSQEKGSNITCVEENAARSTYGANIYDIYKDSFYFQKEDKLLIIGEFVCENIRSLREKMKEIKEKLNDRQNLEILKSCRKDLEDCAKEIGYIDDPMLKGLLLSSYDEIFRLMDERLRIFAHIDQLSLDEIDYAVELLEQRKEKMETKHGTADNAGGSGKAP